ncbi:MAG: glycosyltransferase family 2 protein [Magnetococcales bacterium]|nr:glycosyltransferase family 2 protein [Magnetococcales bacterium]
MTHPVDDQRPSQDALLSIVVPVYQSEPCLEPLLERIHQAMASRGITCEVILVNDGSRDGSWRVIETLCARHSHVIGVNHRRNFGQENATMTGMRLARGGLVATMDDDLQNDPFDLLLMIDALHANHSDVVYGFMVPEHEPFWKRFGREVNNKTLEWLLNKPKNVRFTSFRLMTRETCQAILFYEGAFPFVDTLISQVTTKYMHIRVGHRERHAGVSNFTLFKSIQTWMRVVVSFSVTPLRFVTFTGIAIALLGMLAALLVVMQKLFMPEEFSPYDAGWASLMVVMLIMNGMQMCFIGILGEYVGRSYVLLSRRPQSIIAKVLNAPHPALSERMPHESR